MSNYHSSFPHDHILQTEWWSERITDGNMRGTRDHYTVLRKLSTKFVVHTGFKDSPERGYCSGDYYDNYWDALEGFAKRSRNHGFMRAFDPHLIDTQRNLDVARGELHYLNTEISKVSQLEK